MKIPKEYSLISIVGLFLLAYLLDAIVDPLTLPLKTPYHFLQSEYMLQYPFTSASLIIKSIALFFSPLWIMSLVSQRSVAKASVLLILASLMQLYALQEVATKAGLIPLEWSLSLSLAGVALLLPAIIFFIRGLLLTAHQNISNVKMEEAIKQAQREEE
ncbi:MAG: hypothetical protein ABFQ62_00165 [Patescibacteria group bacterium]